MSTRIDILIDDDNDLLIEGGDFVTGDALQQDQLLILSAHKGEWKQHPVVGVGLSDYLKGDSRAGLKAEIKQQLRSAGMRINKLEITGTTINIDADYQS